MTQKFYICNIRSGDNCPEENCLPVKVWVRDKVSFRVRRKFSSGEIVLELNKVSVILGKESSINAKKVLNFMPNLVNEKSNKNNNGAP